MLSRRKITGDLLVLLTGGLLALAQAGCSVSGAAGRLTWDRKPVLDHSPRFPAGEWERPQRAVLEGFLHAYQPCVIETDDSEYPYRIRAIWIVGRCFVKTAVGAATDRRIGPRRCSLRPTATGIITMRGMWAIRRSSFATGCITWLSVRRRNRWTGRLRGILPG